MDATVIQIESPEQERELRARVTAPLPLDVAQALVAFACHACGAVIGFTDLRIAVAGRSIACHACGAPNAL